MTNDDPTNGHERRLIAAWPRSSRRPTRRPRPASSPWSWQRLRRRRRMVVVMTVVQGPCVWACGSSPCSTTRWTAGCVPCFASLLACLLGWVVALLACVAGCLLCWVVSHTTTPSNPPFPLPKKKIAGGPHTPQTSPPPPNPPPFSYEKQNKTKQNTKPSWRPSAPSWPPPKSSPSGPGTTPPRLSTPRSTAPTPPCTAPVGGLEETR